MSYHDILDKFHSEKSVLALSGGFQCMTVFRCLSLSLIA